MPPYENHTCPILYYCIHNQFVNGVDSTHQRRRQGYKPRAAYEMPEDKLDIDNKDNAGPGKARTHFYFEPSSFA